MARIRREEQTCSTCDGSGERFVVADYDYITPLYKRERCSACGGKGRIVVEVEVAEENIYHNCTCGGTEYHAMNCPKGSDHLSTRD